MAKHERFGWDDKKARDNVRKHRVTFQDAATVLADPFADAFHATRLDERIEHEERWITVGSHPYNRSLVFFVVWATKADESGPLTWIITARRATRQERIAYEERTYPI